MEGIFVYARLADCMNFIQFHGLRHWDLHGDNYIVDESGEPIIIDFGNMSSTIPRTSEFYDDMDAMMYGAVTD